MFEEGPAAVRAVAVHLDKHDNPEVLVVAVEETARAALEGRGRDRPDLCGRLIAVDAASAGEWVGRVGGWKVAGQSRGDIGHVVGAVAVRSQPRDASASYCT